MSANLANGAGTVQFPLVKHAEGVGWTVLPDAEALHRRGGEAGLFFYGELEAALLRLNPGVVTAENVQSIVQRMESVPKTIEGNREILEWLRGNRTVYDEREKRHRNVTLIDFVSLERNVFHVTCEWTFKTGNRKGNRADVVFLVNGVPVAIVENKNPKLPDAMERAIQQLRRYEAETPELLLAPQVFNITHLIEYFYGVTWSYSHKGIFNWKEEVAQASSLRITPGNVLPDLQPFNPYEPVAITNRNLPHWQQEGTTYFVTFRLADALPPARLRELEEERETWLARHGTPKTKEEKADYYRLFSQRVEDWLDAGTGSCALARSDCGQIVADALKHFHGHRYRLGAWVAMPNHMHVVFTPLAGYSLSSVMHSWKSFTANQINKLLGRTGEFWQHESFDHIVRDVSDLHRIEEYVARNPEKAGVTCAQQGAGWVYRREDDERQNQDASSSGNYKQDACVTVGHYKQDACATSFGQAVRSFFERRSFLLMLKGWILFYLKDDELQKTVLRQHQTRAATKVVARCADQTKRTGLVWHTQGSGKTFTLITAGRLILEDIDHFPGATVMLVVDRNELEGQLSGWVERLVGEMQGRNIKIAYADSRARLQELLDQDFRGLIISMIHKFEDIRKDSCNRANFYVLIDEAHRSTGGDLGSYLMAALPNATLIGFTGTPIDKTAYGQGTFKVFGKEDEQGYLDKYSIRESIKDGTTLILRHTLAPSTIRLPEDLLEKEFLSLAEAEGVSDIEELNRILDRAVNLKAFLKANDRVDQVAQFVADHFKKSVEPLGYKAFLVAVDREACAKYKAALDKYLPPEYSTAIYTQNAADAVERPLVAKLQLDPASEKKARKVFPKPDQNPKIFIVTDKLLTGYDAPILYCMYLDKPMRDHVLLQAVARVNRPYKDAAGVKKPCGLILDFVGVLKELNKALAFDSDEVSGVIENLDVLLSRFTELMDGRGREYLQAAGGGGNDEKLEKLLYETFLDKEKRQEFVGFFKEVETLYEVLSPSPDLRDYIDAYHRLTDLYVMLRNAYGKKTTFHGDIARKTEKLVRESVSVYGLDQLTKTAEFDTEALEALKQKGGSENAKIINLVRSLQTAAARRAENEPYLIPIAARAEAVMAALEDRQVSTKKAMNRIEAIVREKMQAENERKETNLDANTFTIYWLLKHEKLDQELILAKEINALYLRFPNCVVNVEEQRQLKAEIYKLLLRVVSGKRMVELTEQILKLKRQ
ncbi:MAG: HsdR family type I site-specific deoxyribonuclease [Verrucomicrobia bacterium]|nr:HsdR family type I site-specific deoxyribonuclease [Verrucomicrobiota bacterium]